MTATGREPEPPSPAPPDRELQRAVEAAVTRRLVADPPFAELAHIVLCGIVAVFLGGHVARGPLAVWLAAIAGAAAWRAVRRRRLLAADPPPPPAAIRRAVRQNVTLLGLAWGLGAMAFAPALPFGDIALLMVILSGFVAFSVVTLVADRPAFLLYATCMLLSLAVAIARGGVDSDRAAALVLTLVFALFTYQQHTRFHRAFIAGEAASLRLETSVAESRRARDELTRTNALLRGVLDAATSIAVLATDREGTITVFNRGAERLLGYSAAEVVGRANPRIFHLEEELERRARELGALRGRPVEGIQVFTEGVGPGGATESEWTLVRKDGKRLTALLALTPLAGGDGEVTGYLGIARDVTEQRRAESDLRETERGYRELVESASDLVFRGDAVGRWTFLNAACERIYGLAADELIGRPFVERVHPDHFDSELTAFHRLVAGAEIVDHDTVHLAADGTPRHLSFSIRPLRDAAGRFIGCYGIARDITERALAAQAVREARDAAERAALARSQFLANMSHEIRTPMNAVLGMTEVLLESGLTDEQRRSMELVRSAGEGLLALLNDVLDFSKIEADQLELEAIDFDLRALVESLAALFAVTAGEKGVALTTDLDPWLPRGVRGDPNRLRQVLGNLIGNAIKFTPAGEVLVRAHSVPSPEGGVVCRFAVRDTGIGIPAEQMDRIFDAFSQADASTTRRYGGTGLGLAIARRIVRLMGGDLAVASDVGAGTEFSFELTLPLAAAAGEAAAGDRAGEEPPAGIAEAPRRLSILLAEDNAVNQEVALSMLSKRGHDVEVAADGRQAVEAVRRGRFDAVLMDIQMPEMDGFAATAAIRALPGGDAMPIVACTAHALSGERERCLAAGMTGYLAKPYKARELFAAVERWSQPQPEEPSREEPSVVPAPGPTAVVGAPPPAADAVDLAAFRRSLGEAGAEEAAAAILALFLREGGERAAAIAAALETADGRAVARAAHAFKSAAAAIAARPLAALLAEIEAAGRAGELAVARSLGARLVEEHAAVVACLRSALGDRRA